MRTPHVSILIFAALASSVQAQRDADGTWKPEGIIRSERVSESSGLAASSRDRDLFFTHNDSGNAPEIFAIRTDGSVLHTWKVRGARNVDWEDMASDGEGHLYIGDIGDNAARRKVCTIYVVDEPSVDDGNGMIDVRRSITYRYPEGPADAEALVYLDGALFVMTKRSLRPVIYRLPLDESTTDADGDAEQVIVARPVGRAPMGFVTAADVRRLPTKAPAETGFGRAGDGDSGQAGAGDGEVQSDKKEPFALLALLGYGQLTVVEVTRDLAVSDPTTVRRVAFPYHQTEACAFDGEDIIITAENRRIWRITPEDVRRGSVGLRAGLPDAQAPSP